MIKVEKLENDCQAFINDNEQLLLGQLITPEEFETITVKNGSITLSIHEQELVTLDAIVSIEPIVDSKDNTEINVNNQEEILSESTSIEPMEDNIVELPKVEISVKPTSKVSKPKAK